MGDFDAVTKDYIGNPDTFADLFNKFLYHGEQVIRPEALRELDSAMIAVPYGAGDAGVPIQRYRDRLRLLVAMEDDNAAYCILGAESQKDIHYAMPVKNGLYDFTQLAGQVSQAAASHRRKENREKEAGQASGAEYLSGFWKTDRLIPVITVVIYWGPDEWDGSLNLKDMYNTADETLLKYAPDYHVNLIAPFHMSEEEINEFHTDLREVMLYIKYSEDKDREKLQEVMEKDERFRHMDRQAAEVINRVTNSGLKYPEGKEVNVCGAIEAIRKEGMEEGEARGEARGEIRGIIKTYMDFNDKKDGLLDYLLKRCTSLDKEKANEYIEQYWKEQ